ncbi:MAG: hypothetical protein WCL50_00555 [Spirochaetota bacterium]
MAGLTKIESYLIDLGISYEEVGSNTWLIDDHEKGLPSVIASLADPVVVISAKVMQIPSADREAFFRELLTLNGGELLHGAYALEGEDVVLIDTLEYGTMDKSEFEASLDAIGFALSEHYPRLSRFSTNK